jgi:hypothetical protein
LTKYGLKTFGTAVVGIYVVFAILKVSIIPSFFGTIADEVSLVGETSLTGM